MRAPPRPLARSFYAGDALAIAPRLIGRTLVHESPEGTVTGRIVEVEAYRGQLDAASHSYRGLTRRNAVMFGPPGHLYVYFTYGMHYCANVVCGAEGQADAVLLRAVEPLVGRELMAARRGTTVASLLARGPARLAQAFGLDGSLNGADLTDGPVWVGGRPRLHGPVHASPRIGISRAVEEPWRFFEAGPWHSAGRGSAGSAGGAGRVSRRPVGRLAGRGMG